MVRAHSLLYAIYICLLVALLCGALLYIASLYDQLNTHYGLQDELLLHNQSHVNYALAGGEANTTLEDEATGIRSDSKIRPYGILSLLEVKSARNNDSVVSLHLLGSAEIDRTCVFVPRLGSGLGYSGNVKLTGDKKLPEGYIRGIYIESKPNKLDADGKIMLSDPTLPELSATVKNATQGMTVREVPLDSLLKNDSGYYNPFSVQTLQVNIPNPFLGDVDIKGNVILRSADSIVVSRNTRLRDVILIAPKIILSDGFKGTLQAFASEKIETGEGVLLEYPSVLYVDNRNSKGSTIRISKNNKIYGAIILAGNPFQDAEKHSVEISESSPVVGVVYCSGTLTLKSNVSGNVYANRFMHVTPSSKYSGCIADIEVNALDLPAGYLGLPIFELNKKYDIIKKVL